MYRRNRRWWIAYYDRNRELRESSYSEDRDVAEALLLRRVAMIKVARVARIETRASSLL